MAAAVTISKLPDVTLPYLAGSFRIGGGGGGVWRKSVFYTDLVKTSIRPTPKPIMIARYWLIIPHRIQFQQNSSMFICKLGNSQICDDKNSIPVQSAPHPLGSLAGLLGKWLPVSPRKSQYPKKSPNQCSFLFRFGPLHPRHLCDATHKRQSEISGAVTAAGWQVHWCETDPANVHPHLLHIS